MRPVIAIVGRPNVGKSTLYNRLTRSREALVDDRPGVTRDRMFGLGRMGEQTFWVVDTGGLSLDGNDLTAATERQVDAALAECDAVIFVVDGREGPCAADYDIAARLRRRQVGVYLAANKTEGLDKELVAAEFYDLGLANGPYPISGRNGDGVRDLIERILDETRAAVHRDEELGSETPHVAVVGRPNVGKSTLVNRLLGEERMVVYDEPGTTRDSVRVPFRYQQEEYVLVDTAGVRRKTRIQDRIEKFSAMRTLRTLEQVHVAVLVLDARSGVTDQDARLAGTIRDSGRSMVIAVNKWDGLDARQRRWVRDEIHRKLAFLDDVPVLYISALHGSGVGTVMPAVRRAYESAVATLATSRLNAVLRSAVESVPPPMAGRRRIRLKYAHQGGKNPPLVVIHGNLVDRVPESYRRYLANSFRRGFGLTGTVVQIAFRTRENPYARPRAEGGREAAN